MILSRLFKPKWQHPDPQVRKAALHSLSPADPALVQAAREDDNPGVRRAALYRIADLNLLQHIAAEDPEAGVRETAEARIRKLLAGQEADSPELQQRLAFLHQPLPSGLLEFIAEHGMEPELRLASLNHIANQTLFGDLAINDPAANVRMAALERVCDETTLQRVLRQTRKSDKRVSRGARARLDALRAEYDRTARSHQLCGAMEALAAAVTCEPNAGHFQQLEKAWESLQGSADDDTRERYRGARGRFLERLQRSTRQRRETLEACRPLERLLERLQSEAELSPDLESTIRETLNGHGADRTPVDARARAEERSLHALVQAIEERERILHRNRERADRLRALLQEADALLHQPSEVLEREVTDFRRRWGSLERPETKELNLQLQTQFDAALGRLQARLRRQLEQRDQELKEIQHLVAALEEALAAGALQRAISLHDQARHHLAHSIGLSRNQMSSLTERLRACAPRITDLRGWRRWGTNQAREGLCEEVERLDGAESDPPVLARQIKEARAVWKAMDSAEGAAPKALWERFDRACERAYQPCQSYFETQARERQDHLEKKTAICEHLEQFEASTDWARVDWRGADRVRRDAQRRWRGIGPVGRADRKELERRYDAALRRLDAHLQEERQRDLLRRRALVAAVQELAQGKDLRAAIEGAKKAQADWQPTVLSTRREEQALWREFRAACDAVFERRQAEYEAADHEREANLMRKTALCDELEALAARDDPSVSQPLGRVQQLRQEWESVGSVPRVSQREIEQRFSAALEGFEARGREQRRAAKREQLDNLRAKARLCERVEALLGANEPAAVAAGVGQALRDWQELQPLPAALEGAIRERFDAACHALDGDEEIRRSQRHALEEGLEKKKTLCVRMEIVAGVDTPPEFAQARMECQVSRLSASLAERSSAQTRQEVTDEACEIEQAWYLTGSPASELNAGLAARFAQAVAALEPGRGLH